MASKMPVMEEAAQENVADIKKIGLQPRQYLHLQTELLAESISALACVC